MRILIGVELQFTAGTNRKGWGCIGRQHTAQLVQILNPFMNVFIIILQLQCLVEVVEGEHVIRVLYRVDGDGFTEKGRGPQGYRVQREAIVIINEQFPSLEPKKNYK